MRAPSKLVWVSLILLCESFGVWSYAQGNNSYAPPRQARRDVPAVNGWPTFDSEPVKGPQDSSLNAPVDIANSTLRADGSEPFELTKIVAQVGDQIILKGELIADANLMLSKDFSRIEQLPEEERSQARSALLESREILVENLLQQAIERKLMYLEALRPATNQDEKKKEEVNKKINKQVVKVFHEQLTDMAKKVREGQPEQYQSLVRKDYQLFRIAVAMKDANIESTEDPRLERVLRNNGTSLYSQQQAFMERVMGKQAIGGHINFHPEITHDQMLAYYREHIDDALVQTRAKWEQLTVLFSRCKDKQEAENLINSMGNQVYLGGAEFSAVARKYSQEKNAQLGGQHDWTNAGDLRISKELNEKIFSLPLNALSRVIEDDEGFHIIRVIAREESHYIPFVEAQLDIKDKLHNEALNKQYTEYIARLREITPIWTADKGFLPRDGRTRR